MTGSGPAQKTERRKVGASGVPRLFFKEIDAGGFSRKDGTVQFYLRVNALLRDDMTVVDLGAGRGVISTSTVDTLTRLATLRGKVREVIGLDVDPVVMTNPLVDRAILYDGKRIPVADNSVDLIVSDHTFEHVEEPSVLAAEIYRILKPGGWLCARTPYSLSLVAVAARLTRNRDHARLLKLAQPNRNSLDVFPTRYKLNSFRALARYFPARLWKNVSYTWTPEPSYYFASRYTFFLLHLYQSLKLPFFGEVLLVFLQKTDGSASGNCT